MKLGTVARYTGIKCHRSGIIKALRQLNNLYLVEFSHILIIEVVQNMFGWIKHVSVLFAIINDRLMEVTCPEIWPIFLSGFIFNNE